MRIESSDIEARMAGMEGEAVLWMTVPSGESRLDTDSEASVVWVVVES